MVSLKIETSNLGHNVLLDNKNVIFKQENTSINMFHFIQNKCVKEY